LDEIPEGADPSLFRAFFAGLDALEEAHYYQIVRGRVEVLAKFECLVDADSKEKVLQEHIYKHLWLLDPSWERATTNKRMEQTVKAEFKKIDAKLSEDEKKGRIDIRYQAAAGTHIIVELKKYSRRVTVTGLVEQITKYRHALEKCLKATNPDEAANVECICIVGEPPEPYATDPDMVKDTLRATRSRFITYDNLIRQTQERYEQYLEADKHVTRVRQLIDKI